MVPLFFGGPFALDSDSFAGRSAAVSSPSGMPSGVADNTAVEVTMTVVGTNLTGTGTSVPLVIPTRFFGVAFCFIRDRSTLEEWNP